MQITHAGHLNINSFRNKFILVEEIIQIFDHFFYLNLNYTVLFQRNFLKLIDVRFLDINVLDSGKGEEGAWGILYSGHFICFNLEILTLQFYQSNKKCQFLNVYKLPNQNEIEFLNKNRKILDNYLKTMTTLLSR